jgi:DnaK suppressor protein
VQDEAEQSEADSQSELEFALLQMQGETLERIADALDRLDAGHYGRCTDCGAEIAARRLQALPFATRCRGCEQAHETADNGHALPPNWQGAVDLLGLHG